VNGRSAKQRFLFCVVILNFLLLGGCGAPGEPQPPSPPIPSPINDLAAHQQGNGVQLVFTLPGHTVAGDRLSSPPAIEIFRGALKPNGSPDSKSFKLVYTIPGALANSYAAQGKIQFTDPLPPEDLRAKPGAVYVYRVRTRASEKKDSTDSNTVTAKVYPVPDRIASLDVRVTQNAIELSWPVPQFAAAASVGETVTGYRVYRGELAASSSASNDLSQAKWKSPPILLAPSQSNSYRDTLFDFGKTYVYQVRSLVIAEGNSIESDDSTPAIVTPRDTFPPAAPQNLVVAEIPGENGAVSVDLSWSINLENDLAGYRIYRSEQQGERGHSLQVELLLSPAYRDVSVQSGHRYWYVATAVDRAGNESVPSEPVLADLTKPLP
jgi:fibronectin type 3 domain-containing protein